MLDEIVNLLCILAFMVFLEFSYSVCSVLVGSDVYMWPILTLLMWNCDLHVSMTIESVVQIVQTKLN